MSKPVTPPIVKPDDTAIARAAAVLAEGGRVGMPTETVYGLACHALDAEAVAGVFAAKARPSFDPLIVHVASAEAAWGLVGSRVDRGARGVTALSPGFRKGVERLAEVFWPGPLTLVLPKGEVVPDIVTSGMETVGLRVPAHPVARSLIEALGEAAGTGAVAAPSANMFGGVSPTRAEHVTVPCDLVLDGGACATGVESTVVRPHDDGTITVLRLGGTTLEQLEAVVGAGEVVLAKPGEKVSSPGMLDRHYAPRTPLVLVDQLEAMPPDELGGKRVGLLSLRGEQGRGMGFAVSEVLSARGDVVEAAARLFAALRRLDEAPLDLIVAERVPEQGLGRAINDRLRRAAT